ncbi:hypothetical protein ACLOJK_011268 [Asimina triloba]
MTKHNQRNQLLGGVHHVVTDLFESLSLPEMRAADLGLVISVGDVGISLETMGAVVDRLPGWRRCLLPWLPSSDLHGCRRLISMAADRSWLPGYQICYLRGLAFSLVRTDLSSGHSPVMGCAGSLLGKMMEHRIRCSDGAL